MSSAVQSPYSSEQIAAWLRGLLTIALADGNFDEQEKQLIHSITQNELAPGVDLDGLEVITPAELGVIFGKGTPTAENFMRTAVMVAIADGIYSPSEAQLLQELCQALELQTDVLESLNYSLEYPEKTTNPSSLTLAHQQPNLLYPVRDWLDGLEVQDPRLARFLCKMIPSQCPFERDVTLFGHKIVHIPPLCKINPLYEQLVGLRFRALSYLADECHEDVTPYI
ncbi:MAG TPA: Mo-dependent nitrogenase C-terminal domain-containing protein [Nostocaceae cyanobacterium]|nr:Mo-dependent nitrogenase C-terminal domain-containing protein [Nostocaceae cyanobacterium]